MGAKLTAAQRRNLALLTDEWQSIYDIAAKHQSGWAGVSGIATACSSLSMRGLADWRVINELSSYRITPAGRTALSIPTPTHEGERK